MVDNLDVDVVGDWDVNVILVSGVDLLRELRFVNFIYGWLLEEIKIEVLFFFLFKMEKYVFVFEICCLRRDIFSLLKGEFI